MADAEMKTLLPSRFLRVFERGELVALLHWLRPEPIYLSKKKWQELVSSVELGVRPSNDIVSEFLAHKLLITDIKVDQEILDAVRSDTRQSLNRPTILYLMMAQGCNFECSYCPIPALAKRHGENLLSFGDAVSGIVLWQKHIEEYPPDDDPYFLIFYGGEPLLNREVVERLLPYVDEEQYDGRLPKKLERMLCTNGSLMGERLAKLLAHHKVTVAIGVDGPPEHNDRVRITRSGDSTFTIITDAIKQLVDNGVRVVASVTITPKNVHQLAEYPDFLRNLGIAQFGFNLMKGEALTRELAGGSVENYCRAAAQGILHGLVNVTESGQSYEYQLEKKLATFKNALPFSVDCTCYGNQLVIQADGQVTNCPFFRFDQGRVGELPDTFRISETEIVHKWRQRISLFSDSILTQYYGGIMDGGGCAWSSSELHGDIAVLDTNNNSFTKEIMHELVWTLLPREQRSAIERGETTHWCYRGVRPVHTARADGL
jgi:sulfatase maturation enzyme AslB (radical SAM superfamily)